MELNDRKELFSDAFLYAITARAGCTLAKPSLDRTSTDWCVKSVAGMYPQIDVQLKCTSQALPVDDEASEFSFVLDNLKNYADLIEEDVLVPRLLIVVFVPEDLDEWVILASEQLVLRHCAYWVSLRGEPPTENTSSITIKIPANQRFDHEALSSMMEEIEQGDFP